MEISRRTSSGSMVETVHYLSTGSQRFVWAMDLIKEIKYC